jgi:hypothetical protein
MRQSRIVLLLLCLAAGLLTGCPDGQQTVPKDSANPDGISSCPSHCICEDTGDAYYVYCDGGGEMQ